MKRAGDAPARFSASSVFPLTPRPLDTYVPRNVWPLHKHYYPNCLRATLKLHTGKSSASLLLFPNEDLTFTGTGGIFSLDPERLTNRGCK